MAAILSRPQCVKKWLCYSGHRVALVVHRAQKSVPDSAGEWPTFLPPPLESCSGTANADGPRLVTGELPAQRPVTQSFDVFFDLCLNKWLSKQSCGWWFETPSRSLWGHCNVKQASHYIRHELLASMLETTLVFISTCSLIMTLWYYNVIMKHKNCRLWIYTACAHC